MNPAKRHTAKNRAPDSGTGSSRKIANSLVALSSAAVLTVYAAGYQRTRAAADRFAGASERRAADPNGARAAAPVAATPGPADLVLPTAPRSAAPSAPEPKRVPKVQAARTSQPKTAVSRQAPAPEAPRTSTSLPSAAPTETAIATLPATPIASPPPPAADPHPPEPVPTATAPARPQYKDGTYLGWGTSRHGDIQASVVIEGGRIASASIAQCLTRYSCSWIAPLPPQVAIRQSPEVDYVSGATQSTNAFYYAVVEALSKAK